MYSRVQFVLLIHADDDDEKVDDDEKESIVGNDIIVFQLLLRSFSEWMYYK